MTGTGQEEEELRETSSSSSSDADNNNKNQDDDSDSSIEGEQVRISLRLAPDCKDRSLEVPGEPIAVPASVSRKGLSAVLNHLLDRRLENEEEEEEEGDDDEDDDRLPPLKFDFIVGGAGRSSNQDPATGSAATAASNNKNRRLLRVGVEREARRQGLSLEEAIPITYFPALEQPHPDPSPDDDDRQLPDWISAMSIADDHENREAGDVDENNVNGNGNGGDGGILVAACYDGSIHCFRTGQRRQQRENGNGNSNRNKNASRLEKMGSVVSAHGGAVKCLSVTTSSGSASDNEGNSSSSSARTVWIASGSLDHTLSIHTMDVADDGDGKMSLFASCQGGHASAIGSVDTIVRESSGTKLLASGEWDGGVCLWDFAQAPEVGEEGDGQSNKRSKTSTSSPPSKLPNDGGTPTIVPKVSIQAHSSKVSGVSWGNFEKRRGNTANAASIQHLVTGSWDHSLKLWDVERQDCLLTLNGSRVVSCLDTSYHAPGIVATGHPDCTVRLWDVRTNESKPSSLTMDTTFKPSHSEWVSAVHWSKTSPYHLMSSSHDGRIKLWDIRSSIPLYTLRAFPKNEKALCMAHGSDGLLASGGTDCIVKLFIS